MTVTTDHVHPTDVMPPATPEDSALAQLQMMLAGGASVDPHQLLGQKEARLVVVTQALGAAIEELKKWSALGLPYEIVKKLTDDHKAALAAKAAAEAVTVAHDHVDVEDIAAVLGDDVRVGEHSETLQKKRDR